MNGLRAAGALCRKEWLSLLRDWHALGLLFIMPVLFILILSLGLEGLYDRQNGLRLRLAVADADRSAASAAFAAALARAGAELVPTVPDAGELPSGCQAIVSIPSGFGAAAAKPGEPWEHRIGLSCDPALDSAYRLWIEGTVRGAALEAVGRSAVSRLARALPGLADELDGAFEAERWVAPAAAPDGNAQPSPLQLNVPGWALFAMFMTSLPLAGSLVRERRDGLNGRLRTLPVGPLALLAGKALPYALLTVVQFAVLLAFGLGVVPLLTDQPIRFAPQPGLLLPLLVLVAATATALGSAVGAVARSPEQTVALAGGAVIVLAALGGVMVPVFAMPPALQAAARLSPVYWSHQALVDIMVGTDPGRAVQPAWAVLALTSAGLFALAAIARSKED